jgi:hypothetical protein
MPALARDAPTLTGASYEEQMLLLARGPGGEPEEGALDPTLFTDDALKGMSK